MKSRRMWATILISASLVGCPSPDPGGTPGNDAATPHGDAGTVEPGTDGGTVEPGTDGGTVTAGWHAIDLGTSEERVTGIYCSSPTSCVVSTHDFDESHLYATDSHTITGTLLSGNDAFGELVGVIGGPDFLGFSRVGDRVIARLDTGGSGFVSASATSDLGAAASWSTVRLGTVDGEGFALNAQYGFASDGARWLQFRNSLVYATTDVPGPSAAWDLIWSPQALPPVPTGILDMHDADPTICSSDPGYSMSPRPTQAAYVAADLSLVLSPANALNQDTDDVTGVCISTDGGRMFHLAPLPDEADFYGPTALHCTSNDHCIVGGGTYFSDNSTYVYVSHDATLGAASTWTRATIPSHTEGQTFPRFIFFAPDGVHGWIAGEDDNDGMLWATTDGGTTWTDATSQIRGLSTARLWSGLAIDETHIFVGGEYSTLLASY